MQYRSTASQSAAHSLALPRHVTAGAGDRVVALLAELARDPPLAPGVAARRATLLYPDIRRPRRHALD